MEFKVDENLPVEVVEMLRAAGYDAVSVVEQRLSGAEDSEVARACRTEERVLMTLDVGFGDIRTYHPKEQAGIVVLRLRSQEKPHVLGVVQRLLSVLANETVVGAIWIVEEARIRVRG